MSEYINDLLSFPLWFTIPLVASYLMLLGYIIYTIWQYRRGV